MCQDWRRRWAQVGIDHSWHKRNAMNRIIYLVGLVIVVAFMLGFLGLR